ncbi:MAG: LLM class flavin-dependent oxidoreductase [Flavobacteriaceae bacterium]|nr:LLM class flavin-dependent oxidoreductase [Flavobacteriaceae bacterium]
MEIGIDSFAAVDINNGKPTAVNRRDAIAALLQRIVYADTVGLDLFGIGEHHREEFLDAAPHMILAAAAAQTQRIKLTSAVNVLSAADPVRVFQNYATLDLISGGRAEMVVGRGSFSESFPLFGHQFEDYDALFAEKLDLLLQIREEEVITWSGQFRAPLQQQKITPRPFQEKMPIWLGVGGTPQSFVRAGSLGLPLMIAIIGGETHRFRPLVDLYREAGIKAGFPLEALQVGIHSLGYVAKDSTSAVENYFPGYARTFTRIGRERGWPPVTRAGFNAQNSPKGALLVGDPETVAEKILRHSTALGGISRFTFQMDNADLSHEQLMESIALIAEKVLPIVNGA